MGTEENGSFPPHTTTAPAGNIADGRRFWCNFFGKQVERPSYAMAP